MICAGLTFAQNGNPDEVMIPDPEFERVLILLGVDSGEPDGKALKSNLEKLESFVDLRAFAISDITGIEYCTNLRELVLFNSKVTNVPLTTLTKLERLNLAGNETTSLDVSQNTELTVLSYVRNTLDKLDVSNNPKLRSLFVGARLTELDVSNNPELTFLDAGQNSLSDLDVSNLKKLETLRISNTLIENLDLSQNVRLNELDGFNIKLTSLDLSNNPLVRFLRTERAPNLSCIEIFDVDALQTFTELKVDENIELSENCSGDPDPDPDPATTVEADFSLRLDRYPAETTWQLVDVSGAVLYQGGPYRRSSRGRLIRQKFELQTGTCYDFIIKDSYGDGICCRYGNGNYAISVSGDVLATGGEFGNTEVNLFCVTNEQKSNASLVAKSAISDPINTGFAVYPNPAVNAITIDYDLKEDSNVQLAILDITGRIVQKEESLGQKGAQKYSFSINQLPVGTYFARIIRNDITDIKKFVISR